MLYILCYKTHINNFHKKRIYHAESRKTVNRWVESWKYSGSGKMRSTASVTLYEDDHYCLISINKKDVNITHVVP